MPLGMRLSMSVCCPATTVPEPPPAEIAVHRHSAGRDVLEIDPPAPVRPSEDPSLRRLGAPHHDLVLAVGRGLPRVVIHRGQGQRASFRLGNRRRHRLVRLGRRALPCELRRVGRIRLGQRRGRRERGLGREPLAVGLGRQGPLGQELERHERSRHDDRSTGGQLQLRGHEQGSAGTGSGDHDLCRDPGRDVCRAAGEDVRIKKGHEPDAPRSPVSAVVLVEPSTQAREGALQPALDRGHRDPEAPRDLRGAEALVVAQENRLAVGLVQSEHRVRDGAQRVLAGDDVLSRGLALRAGGVSFALRAAVLGASAAPSGAAGHAGEEGAE